MLELYQVFSSFWRIYSKNLADKFLAKFEEIIFEIKAEIFKHHNLLKLRQIVSLLIVHNFVSLFLSGFCASLSPFRSFRHCDLIKIDKLPDLAPHRN